MATNTYSNTFLAALFTVSNLDIEMKLNDDNSFSSRQNFNQFRSNYMKDINKNKFSNKNMRKNHYIGQPKRRGYSH